MSGLMLELGAEDLLLINGARIRFTRRTRICLEAHARFVFGKQVMLPEQATTPMDHLYLALQTAFVGPDEATRRQAMHHARELAEQLRRANCGRSLRDAADQAMTLAEEGSFHLSLRLLRRTARRDEVLVA